jgi:hypothetical protein
VILDIRRHHKDHKIDTDSASTPDLMKELAATDGDIIAIEAQLIALDENPWREKALLVRDIKTRQATVLREEIARRKHAEERSFRKQDRRTNHALHFQRIARECLPADLYERIDADARIVVQCDPRKPPESAPLSPPALADHVRPADQRRGGAETEEPLAGPCGCGSQ